MVGTIICSFKCFACCVVVCVSLSVYRWFSENALLILSLRLFHLRVVNNASILGVSTLHALSNEPSVYLIYM